MTCDSEKKSTLDLKKTDGRNTEEPKGLGRVWLYEPPERELVKVQQSIFYQSKFRSETVSVILSLDPGQRSNKSGRYPNAASSDQDVHTFCEQPWCGHIGIHKILRSGCDKT